MNLEKNRLRPPLHSGSPVDDITVSTRSCVDFLCLMPWAGWGGGGRKGIGEGMDFCLHGLAQLERIMGSIRARGEIR